MEPVQQHLSDGQYIKALPLLEQFANNGNGLAMFTLGLAYELEWGVPLNTSLACDWFEKAAKLTVPMGQYKLGQCWLMQSWRGVNQDNARAAFHQALDSGVWTAATALGEMLWADESTRQSAFEHFQLASSKGDVKASLLLAKLFFHGQYVNQNFPLALQYFSYSAPDNQPVAAWYMGTMYDAGLGVEPNVQKAMYWYEVAASQGYKEATLPLAALYFRLSTQDATNEEKWLAKTYLWASVASQVTQEKSALMLMNRVQQEIPSAWAAKLDEQVNHHLDTYHANK